MRLGAGRMRALVVGAGFFLLALAVPIPASAAIGGNVNAPIDCAHTKFQDELAICADPALAKSYEDLRHAYLEDVARFTGSEWLRAARISPAARLVESKGLSRLSLALAT